MRRVRIDVDDLDRINAAILVPDVGRKFITAQKRLLRLQGALVTVPDQAAPDGCSMVVQPPSDLATCIPAGWLSPQEDD